MESLWQFKSLGFNGQTDDCSLLELFALYFASVINRKT